MLVSRYGIVLVFIVAILVVALILLGVQLAIDSDEFVQDASVTQRSGAALPVYIPGAEYVVIPEGTGVPPRYWISPDEQLYSFARVDWNGWGYYLIPDEDPYVRQPTLNSES